MIEHTKSQGFLVLFHLPHRLVINGHVDRIDVVQAASGVSLTKVSLAVVPDPIGIFGSRIGHGTRGSHLVRIADN